MNILKPIETKDTVKKDRIEYEKKDLSQLTLPEHARLLNELQTHIEENPETSEHEQAIIDKINLSVDSKVLAWAWVISQIKEAIEVNKVSSQFYKDKIKSIEDRNKVLQNRIDSRLSVVDNLMKVAGKDSIEGANHKVTYRLMPEKLRCLKDYDELDQGQYYGFFEVVPSSIKWDNKAILKEAKLDDEFGKGDFEVYREPKKLEIK